VTRLAGDGAVGNFFGHDERPQKLRSDFVAPWDSRIPFLQ